VPVLPNDGAPAPSGAYSPGIRIDGLLFLSGQLPYDETGTMRRGSITEQVTLALDNLDRVARAAGGRLEHAVRVGVYLRDLADFDEMDAAYRARFGGVLPARTTIQTNFHETDVEIDAVIALPDG
jgi:2-iminobutanoate/2-iminopropanoate deaminase